MSADSMCDTCRGTGHAVWIGNRFYVECPDCHGSGNPPITPTSSEES